jgi:lantibiotic modifying enzyme
LPDAIAADDSYDIQTGMAGAVVPLLRLADATGEARWTDLARDIGARLADAARHDGRGARWSTRMFPEGIGGFSHGATGIGWALARLGHATGSFGELAEAGFRFEESLYDEALGGWRDLREPGLTAAAWCHGAAGIGIAAADLRQARWRDVVRRAAVSCWSDGLGWNHTLCHGDLGAWELLDIALTAGVSPPGVSRTALIGHIVSSIEEYGAISGMARDVFAPGLLPGLGGVAYQLLRLHPDCPLPSALLPDPGEVPAR